MNEKGLIEQVLRIINSNYNNIYVVDIPSDIVYTLTFTITNSLVIKETFSYTEFIDIATRFVHEEDLNDYFKALSLNTLEMESQKGNNETKVKYRKLCDAGEYRWYVNIINYLPFEGKKLIFMMSEDVHDRLTDSEENSIKLETEIVNYKTKLDRESESISDAIYQINNLLENGASTGDVLKMRDTREYINSIFSKVSAEHPELNKAIIDKITISSNYRKPSILIVDDSSIIRNSLKRIFQDSFNILIAKDGQEAINILTTNVLNSSFDTNHENIVGILLDLIMPVSDGFQVLEFLQKFNLMSKIPVAIISGDETRETRKRVYQYDIVDMLEKPFNTENIRRRITKIINLYTSGNNMQNIIQEQDRELKNNNDLANIKLIINQIVENILVSNESNRLKKMVQILTVKFAEKHPEYNLDTKMIDNIIVYAPLYNIGAIAIKKDEVVTSASIKKSIDNGLTIIEGFIKDEAAATVATNIIKYSLEMFNGSGYPNNLVGNTIPIEAQIVNMIVRLSQYNTTRTILNSIKTINEEKEKYNPDLVTVLNEVKKELKEIK